MVLCHAPAAGRPRGRARTHARTRSSPVPAAAIAAHGAATAFFCKRTSSRRRARVRPCVLRFVAPAYTACLRGTARVRDTSGHATVSETDARESANGSLTNMVDAERQGAIASTLARVRLAAPDLEPSDTQLQAVAAALVQLASQTALWPLRHFEQQLQDAEVEPGSNAPSELWTQLAVDSDGRYALYLWLTHQQLTSVPHDHNPSWAVVAGICGIEHNTLYEELPSLHAVREVPVQAGTSIAMQAGDIHSVALDGRKVPVMQLHLYGLSIDRLAERKVFDADANRTIVDGNAVPSIEGEAFVLNSAMTSAFTATDSDISKL